MNLFSAPRFPRFELHDLLSNNHLLENSRFAFFLQILERWNSKVAGDKPEGTEIEYRKNEFIFSWLPGAGRRWETAPAVPGLSRGPGGSLRGYRRRGCRWRAPG